MPYKDAEKRREAVRRWRTRNGLALRPLTELEGLPVTRDLLLRALGVQALEGNVVAIRILLREHRLDRV